MKYHAPTKQFTIEKDSLEIVSLYLMYAIRNIRDLAELPRTPHKHDGGMENPQFAEKALIDIAEKIGIDLGAKWPGELDVSEAV